MTKVLNLKSVVMLSVAIMVAVAFVLPVSAAPTTGACVKAGRAAIVGALSPTEGTMGDAVSDGFHGNEPNLPGSDDDRGPNEHNADDPGSVAGKVKPSQSPGPHINGGGFTTWGSVISGAVPATCL